MGCNCCRMLNSYMFKPEELQTNGYVNEAHSYEHDRSKSPTIKISELKSEGHDVIERDRFTGSHDLYNVPEKINAKNYEVESREPTSLSPYAILNINFTGEIKQEDDHSSQSNDNLQTKSPHHQHGLDQNTVHKPNSDEPECIQHELCESMQENTSLTESAIQEIVSSNFSLETLNTISNSSDLNELPREEISVQDANTDPPDKSNHGSSSSLVVQVPTERSRELSLVALMIQRNSARGSKKGSIITNGAQSEDDMDPDVAEALAALAAAIAGEEFEDN